MNLIQKIIIISCCAAALASCKKDNPTPANYISFKVDGVFKEYNPDANFFDDGGFLIDGGPFEKGEIAISFINTPTQTTYHLEDTTSNAIADYTDGAGRDFWSRSGTVVINSFDGNHITGTFAFKGVANGSTPETTNITEGQFSSDVGYVSISPDSCTVCDSTFSLSRRSKLMTHYLQNRRLALSPTKK